MVMMTDKDIKEYHDTINRLQKMSNERKETKYIVVHSSESTPKDDFDVNDIDTQHRKDGLFSCAFHKIIKRDGTIQDGRDTVSYTHLTLPTNRGCRSRWSPYH